MTPAVEPLVVDASVATKWYLTDEPDTDAALVVLRRFGRREINLIAPQHIRSEVPSSITVATKRRPPRLSPQEGAAAIAEFLATTFPTIVGDDLVRAAYGVAQQYGYAFYDGLNLALTSPKAIVPFTAAEGADLHCEPKAPGLPAQRIFDWLDGILR